MAALMAANPAAKIVAAGIIDRPIRKQDLLKIQARQKLPKQ